MEVQFKETTLTFCAKADYSVWSDNDDNEYCHNDDGRMSTHLVVVKAMIINERLGITSVSISKALTDIAMVHRIRKEQMENAVVYGCCSDGYDFSFLCTNNDSRVRLPPALETAYTY